MKKLGLLCLLTGMTAAAIGQNERMLWGSINGTKNASASAYQKYNNVILLSWRVLPGDDAQTGFDLYRSANGGMTVDHDGQGLYSSEYGHGDALHLGQRGRQGQRHRPRHDSRHRPREPRLRDVVVQEQCP